MFLRSSSRFGHSKSWEFDRSQSTSPETCTASPVLRIWNQYRDTGSFEKGKDLQLQKATTNPTEFAANKVLELSNMYPQASKINSMSRKNKVNQSTQELLMAAMVKITVRMNQAQQYMPRALLKSGVSCPVVGLV